jgi:hypothetical protein
MLKCKRDNAFDSCFTFHNLHCQSEPTACRSELWGWQLHGMAAAFEATLSHDTSHYLFT